MIDANDVPVERRLAYLLFRILLGINICLHGVTRLPTGDSGFAGKIESQFAHTALPHPLTMAFSFSLPWAESVIGGLIFIGLFTRMALVLGLSIMILLTFGTSLVQDWQVAGLQLIYGLSYAALLFLLACNRYSIDSILATTRKTR